MWISLPQRNRVLIVFTKLHVGFNPQAIELNPIWVILVTGKVFTHNCDTGKLSALIQC
jgi:SpoU rRNA methylase family enzyme